MAQDRKFLRKEGMVIGELAERMGRCEDLWFLTLRLEDGRFQIIDQPSHCGLHQFCPICAWVWSSSHALRTRAAVRSAEESGNTGKAILVMLAQGTEKGERLESAYGRFRKARRALIHPSYQSRSWKERWSSLSVGVAWNSGVVRGWDGFREEAPKPAPNECWYDVSCRMVLVLSPGTDEEEVAQHVGQQWEHLTRREGGRCGWAPELGGVPSDRSVWATGGWWRSVDWEDLREVERAGLYLAKSRDLSVEELAEVMICSQGHRWYGETGIFESMSRFGFEEPGEAPHRPEAGRSLCALEECPQPDASEDEDLAAWPIQRGDLDAVREAIKREPGPGPIPKVRGSGFGGEEQWWVVAPWEWAFHRAAAFSFSVAKADVTFARARLKRQGCEPSEEDAADLDYAVKNLARMAERDGCAFMDWKRSGLA